MNPAKAGINFLSDAALRCYGLGFVHWQYKRTFVLSAKSVTMSDQVFQNALKM